LGFGQTFARERRLSREVIRRKTSKEVFSRKVKYSQLQK
ncbi:unnamed protein product, partial [Brassica oleracea]